MNITRKAVVASVTALTVAGFASSASALTWDLPAPLAENHMHGLYLDMFQKRVSDLTGGAFTINVHYNGSLIPEKEALKAVRSGQVPIAQFFLYTRGNDDPIFNTSQIPFIAGTTDAAWKMWQLSRARTVELLKKQNAKILMAVVWPETGFYSQEPITHPDQLKGVKFRTFSPMTARMAELFGSSPVQIQVGEIAQAFSTNLVQVMYTSAQTGVSSQAWDFAKYYTNAKGGNKSMTLTVVNEQAYNKLEPGFQKALLDAAADAQTYGWILNDSHNEQQKQILRDHGMIVADPTPEFAAKMDEIGATILKEWAKDAGTEGDLILKEFAQ